MMATSKSKTGKSTKYEIRQSRIFSESFKREKVEDILNKRISIIEFCKLWDVSSTSVYRWIYQYSSHYKKGTKMIVQQDSEEAKTQELLKKVAELERILGQKQMEIDYQSKLIEIASKELDIDLKKSFKPTH
ncbi:transposase [Cellulophaga sp. BC115SP]|nr:transposase [Cellulophaga sp. BC115SP]NBB32058.1 transposase [Cellulophaga sp. BC115SP]